MDKLCQILECPNDEINENDVEITKSISKLPIEDDKWYEPEP